MTPSFENKREKRGSVLILVLWICFGLVSLTLYFAQSMSAELRAANYRTETIAVEQTIAGAIRYVEYVLSQYGKNGEAPYSSDYESEGVYVGETQFWLIGRNPDERPLEYPFFGLVDEASKLNLNTATRTMLEALPGMTPELAGAIIDWKDENFDQTENGAEDETYARLDPPRRAKNAPFESIDELRLVYGASMELLVGEDTNRNGAIDRNEDDGEQSGPLDDRDGQLMPGILEYVTVYSAQPNTRSDGTRRFNIAEADPQRRATIMQQLESYMGTKFGAERAREIMAPVRGLQVGSVAEFMVRSRIRADEFVQIHTDIAASTAVQRGLININTAPEAVLNCIPGIGLEKAPTIVAYRLAHPDELTSMAWLVDVLDQTSIIRAGPYITDQSYQFSADIAAVGRKGAGYARVKVIFDMRTGTPRIVYRQDLTSLGWALGAEVRQILKENKEMEQ